MIDGKGFILQGVAHFSGYGVFLSNRNNVTVQNLDIRECGSGVWIEKQSSNNKILENKILCSVGVIINSSSNNYIAENNITAVELGYGIKIDYSSYNTIIGNNITGFGMNIRLESSDNNVISANHLGGGGSNLYLMKAHSNNVSKNSMINGSTGINLPFECSKNNFFGNNITGKEGNSRLVYSGIELGRVSDNVFYENILFNNSIGVYFDNYNSESAENNIFYSNRFLNNTQDVCIGEAAGANVWNYGEKGNYWGKYTGADEDGDGIGDTAYLINANNIDHYPLIPKQENTQTNQPALTIIIITTVLAAATLAVASFVFYTKKRRINQTVNSKLVR